MMRPVHAAAVAVLRETNNPAVMWGDCGLLDMIHARAGLKEHEGRGAVDKRHKAVLDALSRNPGILIPGKTMCGHRLVVRIFRLPGAL